MRESTSVGLLSTGTHPLLFHLLQELTGRIPWELVLILDSGGFSEKDLKIFEERTGGAFPPPSNRAWLEGVRCTEVRSHNDPDCIRFVREEGLPLLVNAGTPRRVGKELLEAPGTGVLNVHPGLLPKYRGATCPEWAIHYDEPVGVTAHFMDEGLDSGPIIFTRTLTVERGWTYREVRIELYRLWLRSVREAIVEVVTRGLKPEKLPGQPPYPVFRPIPDDLLAEVKAKLAEGRYTPRTPTGC